MPQLRGARGRPDQFVFTILLLGVAVQLVTSLQQLGWWHPDSHFGVIEFANFKLGNTPQEWLTWEYPNRVRQTLPVYLFLGFHELLGTFGVDGAYTQLTVLRVLTGLASLLLFNLIVLHAFRKERKLLLYTILFLVNLSWCAPYIRSLYCYENLGGLAFFLAVYLHLRFLERGLTPRETLLVGFLFGMAFYLRFQMGFALVGWGAWLLFFTRTRFSTVLWLTIGFLGAAGINLAVDSLFYEEFVVTPWIYWKVNIIEGRADRFGRHNVLYYVTILSVMFTVPLLSLWFFWQMLRGFLKRFRNPYTLSVLAFLVAHFIVGHKEERFLIPVVGVLPVVIGYGLKDFVSRLPTTWAGLKETLPLKSIYYPTLVLNAGALIVALLVPLCQQIEFTRRLNTYFDDGEPVQVLAYRQMPYETGARSRAFWYLDARNENISIETVREPDRFLEQTHNPPPNTYFVIDFRRRLKLEKSTSLEHLEPVMWSSRFVVALAERIHAVSGWAMPEMWVLYRARIGTVDQSSRK